MSSLKVTTFGGLSAATATGTQIAFPTRKVAALFAYLAVESDRRHSRAALIALLWPEADEGHGRASLRQSLARLRRALPEAVSAALESDGQSLGFAAAALDCDAIHFSAALAAGDPTALAVAAALYNGPFLAGLEVASEAFEDWAAARRRQSEVEVQGALSQLLEHYEAAGRIERALGTAQSLLAFDPLAEAVQRSLIRLYLCQERYGAALAQYRRCRELFRQELGIAPGEETEALHQLILQQRPAGDEAAEVPQAVSRPQPVPVSEPVDKSARQDRPSIAVLPFADLSSDGTAAHLAIGLTEEVITALTRFRELQVIAPHSAFAYQSAGLSAERAAALLGVRYRLEGGLQLDAERLRLTARLIEAESGRHLWAERFERDRGGFFDLQDELTRRIVASLVARIEGARLDDLRRKPPADWQAEDFWLKGRAALRHMDFRSVARARAHFRRALDLAPDFAPAHAGLATTEMHRWSYFNWQPSAALTKKAFRHARRAAVLDDGDHRIQCILGFTYLINRDFTAARRHLDRALSLNPNDAQVLAHLCIARALLGEAALGVEAGELALRLDPYHPDWYLGGLGFARFAARDYEGAIADLEAVPEALCDTPAYLSAAFACCDRGEDAEPWRALVQRQHAARCSRGELAPGVGCLDWLVSINPFRRDSDRAHFVEGLKRAGF